MLVLWQIDIMKFNRIITFGLAAIVAVLTTSCSTLPPLPNKKIGPKSNEGTIPWNRRLPGEGSAALGGLGQQ